MTYLANTSFNRTVKIVFSVSNGSIHCFKRILNFINIKINIQHLSVFVYFKYVFMYKYIFLIILNKWLRHHYMFNILGGFPSKFYCDDYLASALGWLTKDPW